MDDAAVRQGVTMLEADVVPGLLTTVFNKRHIESKKYRR